ncbi:macrophage mannose receptor 1 isoform X2 [Hydra vulgaris]|uniref:Macrophage mannose receptor 1 isoform X2 n=1 Tax=Hydra vulgaris TaxID=6087 RepID=A0ABM4C5U0_HYDVU
MRIHIILLLTTVNAHRLVIEENKVNNCPAGWLAYKNSCYLFENKKQSWMESNLECKKNGGNLLSVVDQNEHSFIESNLKGNIYFIGLNAVNSNRNFVWSDGTPLVFQKWAPGEPSNTNGIEECGEFNHLGWNDYPCDRLNGHICKVNKELSLDLKWILLKKGACFEGKNDLPANVPINLNGVLVGVKLVHQSGRVKCSPFWEGSNFGCTNEQNLFSISVCDNKKMVLFPSPNQAINYDASRNYQYPVYLPTDKEVIFTNYEYPPYLRNGDSITIWNNEDLFNLGDVDNVGQTCVDIFGTFGAFRNI